jgi:hypothetical protein
METQGGDFERFALIKSSPQLKTHASDGLCSHIFFFRFDADSTSVGFAAHSFLHLAYSVIYC